MTNKNRDISENPVLVVEAPRWHDHLDSRLQFNPKKAAPPVTTHRTESESDSAMQLVRMANDNYLLLMGPNVEEFKGKAEIASEILLRQAEAFSKIFPAYEFKISHLKLGESPASVYILEVSIPSYRCAFCRNESPKEKWGPGRTTCPVCTRRARTVSEDYAILYPQK